LLPENELTILSDTSSNQQRPGWVSFCEWLGRSIGLIARIAIAGLLACLVLVPFAQVAKCHFTAQVSELMPHVETVADFERVAKTGPQANCQPTTDAGAAGTQTVTKTSGDTSHVWVYAIKTLGLFATLGITLWTIVALVRTD
jgi:hypothetical protein